MLAPLTLFVFLCFVNVPSAVVLLVCVPFIPVAIAAVQTWAKKLLSKYWGQYTALGDTFLENLQGLTTLKIYDKIFRLLDLPEAEKKTLSCPDGDIICENLAFSYEGDREILHGMNLSFPKGSFVSIVGESGCGKSTVAAVLMGRNKGYMGSARIGGAELREMERQMPVYGDEDILLQL